MLGMAAYYCFFFSFAFLVGAFFQAFVDLTILIARLTARDESIKWDFKQLGRNIMLWTGMTVFLWHYNFG